MSMVIWTGRIDICCNLGWGLVFDLQVDRIGLHGHLGCYVVRTPPQKQACSRYILAHNPEDFE